MKRSWTSVRQRTSSWRYGLFPQMRDQGAKQEVLREAHPRMRRHFKRAHFQQAQAARGGVRRVQLVDAELGAVRAARRVDEQVSEDAVHQPRRDGAMIRNLLKRDFHFVDLIVASLVDARRLACGSDKESAEEIRQRGMVVPVADQAAQQSGISQDGRIGRRGSSDQNVISAARAGVASIEHEFFRGQAAQVRFFVQRRGVLHQFIPACGWVQIHFDHAGIGSDFDRVHARIVRRRVPFDEHWHSQVAGGFLDRSYQAKIILQVALWRQEHAQDAVARFRAQRCSNRSARPIALAPEANRDTMRSLARPLARRPHVDCLLHDALRGLIFRDCSSS